MKDAIIETLMSYINQIDDENEDLEETLSDLKDEIEEYIGQVSSLNN
jgi:cell division septum initiation protein DivIVA